MSDDNTIKNAHGDGETQAPSTSSVIGESNYTSAQLKTDKQQSEDIEGLKAEQRRINLGTFRLAKLGFFIAFGSLAISGLQWWSMREQIEDAREGGKENTIAMLRAYGIAKQQAESLRTLADANKKLANAQYFAQLQVGVTTEPRFILTSHAQPPQTTAALGKTLRPFVELITLGGSSPRNVNVTLLGEVVPRGREPVFGNEPIILRDGSMTAQDQLRTMREAGFIDARTGKPLGAITQALVDDVVAERVLMLIHGKVTYTDSVGCHWRTFCVVFDPAVNEGLGAFMSCTSHHGIEGDC